MDLLQLVGDMAVRAGVNELHPRHLAQLLAPREELDAAERRGAGDREPRLPLGLA